eukprot:TRINITY_DN28605_c0_g2_i3.p4 TRINITY_DN28605_c0_g2~~TRINITY_DN28605_c0_g2_i3.p4  ORF type:complete len:115 (-),score=42.47 TRINITY_DN28605_c0_g2_i3:51-395(-)
MLLCQVAGFFFCVCGVFFFFFSSRRRHTRCREVSWARRCVQETGTWVRKKYNQKDSIWRLPPSSKEECNIFQSCVLLKNFELSQYYNNVLPVIPETVLQSSEFPEVYATLSKST